MATFILIHVQAGLPCARVIALESDHSPFYSAVAELAEALLGLALRPPAPRPGAQR